MQHPRLAATSRAALAFERETPREIEQRDKQNFAPGSRMRKIRYSTYEIAPRKAARIVPKG